MKDYTRDNREKMVTSSLDVCLQIQKGVTSFIGGGGKSTMLEVLGRQLTEKGTVILMTTTKMMAPPNMITIDDCQTEKWTSLLQKERILCIGSKNDQGKLVAPNTSIEELMGHCDYLLIEADGSARLPMKAHQIHEPVIPQETNQTIWVVGLSGFGRPMEEVTHRVAEFCHITGGAPKDKVTPSMVASVITAENLCQRVFLNQMDIDGVEHIPQEMANLLPVPVVAGSLMKGWYQCL